MSSGYITHWREKKRPGSRVSPRSPAAHGLFIFLGTINALLTTRPRSCRGERGVMRNITRLGALPRFPALTSPAPKKKPCLPPSSQRCTTQGGRSRFHNIRAAPSTQNGGDHQLAGFPRYFAGSPARLMARGEITHVRARAPLQGSRLTNMVTGIRAREASRVPAVQ